MIKPQRVPCGNGRKEKLQKVKRHSLIKITTVLDKFNKLTKEFSQAGDFIKPTIKLSYETPELLLSWRGEMWAHKCNLSFVESTAFKYDKTKTEILSELLSD